MSEDSLEKHRESGHASNAERQRSDREISINERRRRRAGWKEGAVARGGLARLGVGGQSSVHGVSNTELCEFGDCELSVATTVEGQPLLGAQAPTAPARFVAFGLGFVQCAVDVIATSPLRQRVHAARLVLEAAGGEALGAFFR